METLKLSTSNLVGRHTCLLQERQFICVYVSVILRTEGGKVERRNCMTGGEIWELTSVSMIAEMLYE